MNAELDQRVRLAVFQWLRAQMDVHGEVLPRSLLAEGFVFDGIGGCRCSGRRESSSRRLPRRRCRSQRSRAVQDEMGVRRRSAATRIAGRIRPIRTTAACDARCRSSFRWSTSIGSSRASTWRRSRSSSSATIPERLTFDVQVDDPLAAGAAPGGRSTGDRGSGGDPARVRDLDRAARVLHQQAFRARVIEAYRTHCAFCRLRHQELLDAAHITADADDTGEPVVSNGLSLCKLHHAAFDRHFLTVRPGLHHRGSPVDPRRRGRADAAPRPQGHARPTDLLPREVSLQPDRDRLEERYAAFLLALTDALSGSGSPTTTGSGFSRRGRTCLR